MSENTRVDKDQASRLRRLLIALAVGLSAGACGAWVRLSGHYTFSDFDQLWVAGRATLSGNNPYAVVASRLAWPLYYPMPAVVIALPLVALPMVWAQAVWTGVGFAVLAYALSARGRWPLLLLATYPAMDAIGLAQWSPLLIGAALLPGLGWLAAGKPTTGLAAVGAYATALASRAWLIANIVLALVVLGVSFALLPSWVSEWRIALRGAHHFTPIALRPGGFVLLLALLRWKRPEARLIAFLALVPSTVAAYEGLALCLIPETKREVLLFALLGSLAYLASAWAPIHPTFAAMNAYDWPYLLALLYLPALVMVLRRPNCVTRGNL